VRRYTRCLSAGTGAEFSQIRIQGASHTTLPHNKEEIDLSSGEINWEPIRNDLGFELHHSIDNPLYEFHRKTGEYVVLSWRGDAAYSGQGFMEVFTTSI